MKDAKFGRFVTVLYDQGPVRPAAEPLRYVCEVLAEKEWLAVSAGWISCCVVASPPYVIGFQHKLITGLRAIRNDS